jgi:hypothetical protein
VATFGGGVATTSPSTCCCITEAVIRLALCTISLVLVLALGGCGGGEGETTATGGGGEPLDTSNLSEPVEGSKRAAHGVPVSRGGDNSIQTWGLEASAAEREEVTATLQAFYDARAAGEWARVCTYLAARQRAEFAGFVKGRSGKAACAEAMRGLATGVPESAFDREANIDYVLSLRVGEGHAFLIYTRPDANKIYASALAREDGTWKVISVGPTVLS